MKFETIMDWVSLSKTVVVVVDIVDKLGVDIKMLIRFNKSGM